MKIVKKWGIIARRYLDLGCGDGVLTTGDSENRGG